MSDTPRTDALLAPLRGSCAFTGPCADHARQLERELNAAKAEIQAMREAIMEAGNALIKASHVHRAITTYAQDQSEIDKTANREHCEMLDAALAKLQPLLK